jgi:hypothetical protein
MATEHDAADSPTDTDIDLNDVEPGNAEHTDVTDGPPAGPAPSPAAATPPVPAAAVPPAPAAAQPGNLAEISAQLRREAAEITEIAAQAGRLGIAIDAAKALREGTTPEALRCLVLDRASAAADARDIVAAPPSPVLPRAQESPIVAAAKRAASAGAKG